MATKSKRKLKARARKPRAEKIGDDGLTLRQRRWIDEYAVCFNGAEAARRAGYSEASARVIASQNLTKLNIREALQKRLDECGMSKEEVKARLSDLCTPSFDDFLTIRSNRNPEVDLAKAKQRGKLHHLKEYSEGRYGISIKLQDAQPALLAMARIHGMISEKAEVTGPGGAPVDVRVREVIVELPTEGAPVREGAEHGNGAEPVAA